MKRVLTEPLLHFLLLGAGIFAAYSFMNRKAARPDEIVVSAARIEQLAGTFSQFHQRAPTEQELRGVIDQYVQEEIHSREAVKLGLDQDDQVIRRRLQQKLEFVAADLTTADEPTEAELASWLATHADRFREEERFSVRHVYLDPSKHGDRLDHDAAKLLTDLRTAGVSADVSQWGDSFLLPGEFSGESQGAIASKFGEEFARRLGDLKMGEWSGPLRSGYGLHLVLLTERINGRSPSLADVREQVKRDFLNERREIANRQFLEAMLAKYKVTIEWPKHEPTPADSRIARAP